MTGGWMHAQKSNFKKKEKTFRIRFLNFDELWDKR